MDKLETLKLAKEKLDALIREKRDKEQENELENESIKLAMLLESNQSINETIERNALKREDIADAVQNAVAGIKIEVPKIDAPQVSVTVPEIKSPTVNVPEIRIPEIKLPKIVVPKPQVTVNIPEIKLPTINVPKAEINFPEKMDVGLSDFTAKNPLPVISVDPAGNYISPTSGGGGARRVKIDNAASEPIPISGTISATFSADFGSGEVGSQTLRTVQATNAISSVYVTGANGTIGVVTINPDGNPVYGGGTSGGGLTDSELRATSVPIEQVSGSIWSTSVIGTVPVSGTFWQATQPVSVASTLDVQQVSGASWSTNVLSMPSVTVTSITNSVATSILNGDGVTLDPRARTWTITETVPISAGATLDVQQVSGANWSVNVLSIPSVTVTSITNSTASAIVDSTGIAYSGSNPFPVTGTVVVSSVTASTASALVDSTGTQYSGSNPVPTKEVRSATPSQSSPSVGVTSTSILASNTSRLGATIYNEGTATCYMKLGATASLTSYTLQIASGGYYEVPFGYTGAIDGITSASTAQLRVTEIT